MKPAIKAETTPVYSTDGLNRMLNRPSADITRVYNADKLNKVVNHPSVARWVKGSYDGEYLDLTPLAQDRNNVVLMGEHGGVVFVQHQLGLYEAHTQVLPEGRGQWTLDMVNAALNYMFSRSEAVEIVTRVPKGNLGARGLVRAIHGVFEFRRADGWVVDGQQVYADIYALRIQDWMRTAPGLTERGSWFHNRLEQEYARLGRTLPQHTEDTVHDRYVGAAVEMILGNQPQKAIVFYNRWAKIAGYEEIKLVTDRPLVLDIRDALILVRDQNFWVMTCR